MLRLEFLSKIISTIIGVTHWIRFGCLSDRILRILLGLVVVVVVAVVVV